MRASTSASLKRLRTKRSRVGDYNPHRRRAGQPGGGRQCAAPAARRSGRGKGYQDESYWDGLLEYPQYTRPEVWEGRAVPRCCWAATTRRSTPGGGSRAGSVPVCAARSSTSSGVRPSLTEIPKWKRGENVRLVKTAEQMELPQSCLRRAAGAFVPGGWGAGSAGCPDPGDVPAATAAGKAGSWVCYLHYTRDVPDATVSVTPQDRAGRSTFW